MDKNTFTERIQILREQWDRDRNKCIDFDHISLGSGKKFWWKCQKAEDHIWEASFVKRVQGSECPMCAGRAIVPSNCLESTHPHLAKEWNYTNNKELLPSNVYGGSEKKVWWICEYGHEWEAQIKHRAVGGGCPVCNNKKVIPSKSMATTHPHLIDEWHRAKNHGLEPYQVVSGSDKVVWWICPKQHEWQAPVKKRALSNQCCPFCYGNKAHSENNLALLNPSLARQWHFEKNHPSVPEDFRPKSNQKVWWRCDKDETHEYEATISNRADGMGCSICAGRKVGASNALLYAHPELAAQWHPSRNGSLTPADVVSGSTRKVWWKCQEGEDHEWESSLANRVAGKGCPVCAGLKVVVSNSLQTTHPQLSKEWHQLKNEGFTPLNTIAGSHKLVWWKCLVNPLHEWLASIKNRASKQHGCPHCKLTSQSKQELTILFELKHIFPSISTKGYTMIHEGKRWAIDIFIPELSLGIEFDGSYWHRDKEALDAEKTAACNAKGISVIRVREHPLMPTSSLDIISQIPFSPKKVVDDILIQIELLYELSMDVAQSVIEYRDSDELHATQAYHLHLEQFFKTRIHRQH